MAVKLNNTVCPWYRVAAANGQFTVFARGAVFCDDCYLADEALARHVADGLAAVPGERRLEATKALVAKLNGSSAVIVEWNDGELVAAVDRLRTIPLFYGRTSGGELVVANDVRDLDDCVDANRVDEEAAAEFVLSGYVIGSRTLRAGIRQLLTGEMLHGKNGATVLDRHFRFLRSGWSDAGNERLTEELDRVMDRVFSRLIRQFADEQVYVPLSGGLDSRLVLAMLKRYGHRNVVAMTFGPMGEEASTSRAVAEALGVPWEFVSYDDGDWYPLMASKEMRDFWRYSSQDAALPHIQDYLAMHKLRRKYPDLNAVFFPGVVGDMIAGAWVPGHFTDNEGPLDIDKVCQWLFHRKFQNWRSNARVRRQICRRLAQYFSEVPFTGVHNAAAAFDLFEFENRQAKYVGNSIRTLEAHGWRKWLPLCDYELMDFHLTVPTPMRELKRLYALWMRSHVFKGDMARLAEIPPIGDGRLVWYNIPRAIRCDMRLHIHENLAAVFRQFAPRFLKRRWMASHLANDPPPPLKVHQWFAPTLSDLHRVRVADLQKDPEGILSSLHGQAARLVSLNGDYPLGLAMPLGLLAAVYLAELNSRLLQR